jgi:serine O-acetyltransferase
MSATRKCECNLRLGSLHTTAPSSVLLQNVTLGGTGKEVGDRHPKICDNVLIGASATVLGNIVIGKGAQIAAGSLVLKPVAPHTMVAGSPASPVGTVSGNPAFKMQQWMQKFKGKDFLCDVAPEGAPADAGAVGAASAAPRRLPGAAGAVINGVVKLPRATEDDRFLAAPPAQVRAQSQPALRVGSVLPLRCPRSMHGGLAGDATDTVVA